MAFEGTLQEFTLMMHGPILEHPCVEVQQADTASRKVRIHLKTFGGKDYVMPYNATVALCIWKLDGNRVLNACEIEDQSTVIVELTTQAIACTGKQKAQLYICNGDGDIKSQGFFINVPKAIYTDDAIKSSNEYGILIELIEKAESTTAYGYAKAGGYTGTEEEFMKKLAGEYSTPDLSVNDPNAPGYVRNRTHWVERAEVEVLSETTISFASGAEHVLDATLPLEVDAQYTVTWNGKEYACTGKLFESDGTAAGVALGDLGLMLGGISTGEPFVVVALDSAIAETLGISAEIIACDGSTEATISIDQIVETVHKIDNKYLNMSWFPKAESGLVALLEKRVVDNNSSNSITSLNSSMVTDGQIVFVDFDGVRYECTVSKTTDDAEGTVALITIELNGEVLTTIGLTETRASVACASGEHTLAIYTQGDGCAYNKIPTEYIPYFDSIVFRSSESTRYFKITVDDSGNLTAARM